MMQISHAATGAAVGKFMPNPILAFVAGILIHFVIDKIPHWWTEPQKPHPVILSIDYLLTVIFIIVLKYFNLLTPTIIWGIVGSLLVDIILVGVIPIKNSKLGLWHFNRQPHLDNIFSLFTDVLVIFAATLITLAF